MKVRLALLIAVPTTPVGNDMKTGESESKMELALYLPKSIVQSLDQSRGPLSRSRLIRLVLENAISQGIDLGKLVTGKHKS
jgi:hypothetical protein